MLTLNTNTHTQAKLWVLNVVMQSNTCSKSKEN